MPTSTRGLNVSVTDLVPPWRTRGRPVVFHHGIGTSQDIWAGWLPVVAPHHPCVRFDVRGFGASPVPPEDAAWSMDELIDDLFDVAEAAGPGPVHLVGESMGGTVVLAAALRRPERVATVTVSNASFTGGGIGQLGGWRDLFATAGVAGWSARMNEWRFAPGAIDPAMAAWFSAEQERTKPHVALGLGDLLAGTDLTGALPSLARPLLVLSPDASPFVPVRLAAELKERAPDAELRVFPGVRHGLPFSHAGECARTLLDFLHRRDA
ncbi:MAG TPA: alpha/beta hydrolase [Azospirillum sp.]|nr:alpha/beta hydrolase [Azospirillum sp.]